MKHSTLYRTLPTALVTLAIAGASFLASGCSKEDPAAKSKLEQNGFSQQTSNRLSQMNLSTEELDQLARAKQGGIDDGALADMVKALHDRDLKFTIGSETQVLYSEGMSPITITQLMESGALPRWADDISALKTSGVADVTIIQLAKLRFQDKKDLLSGAQYGNLKQFGMSDTGLLTFAQKGGTEQQLEKLKLILAQGKPEQEALHEVGII